MNGDKSRHTSEVAVTSRPFTCTSLASVYQAFHRFEMASRPEMREEDESGFCKFFRSLSEEAEETIRIFDRGDYYSAHGEDAKFIADNVGNLMFS